MKILTCSNSCPQWADGQLNPRSAGGLVPMLNALLAEHGGDWIFTAPPGGDLPESVTLDGGITLHPMGLDEDLRRRHYDTVSIQLLLGLLHYMHDTSVEPVFDRELGEAWAGYETVNRLYAERLTGLSADTADELILINDPHLMLVPEFFTAGKKQRKSKLTYFLGTPWCEPDYFTVLPGPVRTRILESLLACDAVGFHAQRWTDAFAACCARFLPDAVIEGDTITHRGHVTRLVSEPFPLDVDVIDTMVEEPATASWTERLTRMADGRRVMVRADRIDLWKNMPADSPPSRPPWNAPRSSPRPPGSSPSAPHPAAPPPATSPTRRPPKRRSAGSTTASGRRTGRSPPSSSPARAGTRATASSRPCS